MTDYQRLLDHCQTPRQIEVVTSLIGTGSYVQTGKDLGTSRQNISEMLIKINKLAQRRGDLGNLKEQGLVPDGFYAETSVQRRWDPELEQMVIVSDWTKSRLEKQLKGTEVFKDFIEGLCQEIKPSKKTKARKPQNSQLASAIIFGDAHLGMLAHAVATLAEDYDLEKGTADIRAAIDYCVEAAPDSEEGWFINVGDLLHVDSSKNETTGGTKQDVSATHSQMMRAAGTLIRYCINKMLTKFNKVTVINARGNHDNDSAIALNMMIEIAYENEPRVNVLANDSKFQFIEFGKCLIGVNHGDKINHSRLAGVMTKLMAPAWGRTTFRRWITGHIHHKQMVETDAGVTIESFHTMAPTEIWHADSGYGAERRVTMITYHKEHGEVNRMSPSVEMVREAA